MRIGLRPHRHSAYGAAFLLAAARLTAQVPTLATETPVGVFNMFGPQHSAVPAMTAIPTRSEVAVYDPFGGTAAFAGAHSYGARAWFGGSASAASRWGSGSASLGTAQGIAQSASHDWRWTVPGPRNGELVGLCSILIQGTSPVARIEVDVGADTIVEFAAAGPTLTSFRIPLVRAGGFPVRVRCFGLVTQSAPSGESYSAALELAWVESGQVPPARFGPTGNLSVPGCGPRLWPTDVPSNLGHRIGLALTGAFVSGPVLLVVGPPVPAIFIPGTLCALEVSPLIVLPGVADALGAASWDLRIPGPIVAARVGVQAITLQPSTAALLSSDAWVVEFVD